jgi:hypothetical protein
MKKGRVCLEYNKKRQTTGDKVLPMKSPKALIQQIVPAMKSYF